MVYLFTGHPGTGKTTSAKKLYKQLHEMGMNPVILDGDHIRQCWPELGYSDKERFDNACRFKAIAKTLHDMRLTVLICIVAPSKRARLDIRAGFKDNFMEVYLDEILERRPDSYYCEYQEHDTIVPEIKGMKAFDRYLQTLAKGASLRLRKKTYPVQQTRHNTRDYMDSRWEFLDEKGHMIAQQQGNDLHIAEFASFDSQTLIIEFLQEKGITIEVVRAMRDS